MDRFREEVIMLIVTILFLITILTLLIMRIITPDNQLVTFIISGVFYYWGLNGAYRFNPSSTQTPQQPPPITTRPMATDWSRTPTSSTPPPPPATSQ